MSTRILARALNAVSTENAPLSNHMFYLPSFSIFKFHSDVIFSKRAGTYSSAQYPSSPLSDQQIPAWLCCDLTLVARLGFDSGCMKGNLTQILRKTSSFKHLPHLRPLHYLKAIGSLYILMERMNHF